MLRPFGLFSGLTVLLLSGCKTVEVDLALRGIEPLEAPAVQALFSEAKAQYSGKFYRWDAKFRADGTVSATMISDIGVETGTGMWEVNQAGELCRAWNNGWGAGRYGCGRIYRDGDDIVMVQTSGATGLTGYDVFQVNKLVPAAR